MAPQRHDVTSGYGGTSNTVVATTAALTDASPAIATSNAGYSSQSSSSNASTKATIVTLSPIENLAVGAVGGALETCLQMPVLTYKFCRQEGRALPTSISGWYRGVAVQAGTVAPITALQFMVNGMLQNLILTLKPTPFATTSSQLSSSEQIIAAAGAGAISALVYSPVDLITIQQQKMELNPVQTARKIVTKFGLFGQHGLYRGFVSCAGREAVYTAGYLGLAPVLTASVVPMLLNEQKGHDMDTSSQQPPSLMASLTGACLAGTLAAIVTHPLDTAKTCVQSDMAGTKWTSARQSLSILVNQQGGIANWYRGMIPRTFRLCGAFFVCLCVRDVAIQVKRDHYS